MNKDINAIDIVRQMVADGQVSQEVAEKYFPELVESEDERIRKDLISHFKETIDNIRSEEIIPHNAKILVGKMQKWIAWLENQGEQKHTAEEVLIKAGLKPYKDGDQWCVLLGDNIQEGICGFGNTIEDALYAFLKDLIASQGEQKPVDKIEPKFHEGEWVVTDKNNVVQIKAIKDSKYALENTMRFSVDYVDKCWRKWDISDANDGDVLTQKPAWSEEDKRNLFNVKCIIDGVWHNQYVREEIEHSGEELESLWHWLDNLWQRVEYPQNTWKPSEEQMEAMGNAIKPYCKGYGWDETPLGTLYNDLKKL